MAVSEYTTKEIGNLGEDIACDFLRSKGFSIVERNYWKKWGEIDIVAKKGGITHFVEVKSVSHVTGDYRPEENVHPRKLERMRRVIQSYILDKKIEHATWQFDVVTVVLTIQNREARCKLLSDIIL